MWFLAVPAGMFALLGVHWLLKNPLTLRGLYFRRMEELHHQWAVRGLTPEQRAMEMHFREGLVRLRGLASEAVLRSPAKARETITELALQVAKSMAARDRDTARGFLKAVENMPLADLLTRQAMRRLREHDRRTVKRFKPEPHHIDAVTTR